MYRIECQRDAGTTTNESLGADDDNSGGKGS